MHVNIALCFCMKPPKIACTESDFYVHLASSLTVSETFALHDRSLKLGKAFINNQWEFWEEGLCGCRQRWTEWSYKHFLWGSV